MIPRCCGALVRSTARIALLIALLLAATGSAQAQLQMLEVPAAPGAMAARLIADPADGSLLLSWIEPDAESPEGHALRFSRYRDGAFDDARTIARGTDWFVNWADTPGLHPGANGHWIAHWLQKSGPATYAYDIRLARSIDGGRTWTPAESPHRDGTQTEHGFVSHFLEPDGGVGLVWLDGRNTGSAGHDHEHGDHHGAMTLRSTRIEPDGTIGPSIELDARVCDCCQTASAMTALGPIVVYRDRSEDEVRDIAILRRIDSRWTAPRLVHADGWVITGCPVNGPAVAAVEQDVAVAWFTMAENRPSVRVAFSDDAGESFSPPQEFSAGEAIGRVDLLHLDGEWILTWMAQIEGQAHLQLARFDRNGELRDHRALTRMDGGRISGFPRIGAIGRQLLVVWTDRNDDPRSGQQTRLNTATLDPDRQHGSP